MKKFLVAILAILYITASSGTVVHLHYCMDKLTDWGLWKDNGKTDKCSTCGMSKSKKKGCCKEENKIIKIEKDQRVTDLSYKLSQPLTAVLISPIISLSSILPSGITENKPVSNSPPAQMQVPLYLLNCVFRN